MLLILALLRGRCSRERRATSQGRAWLCRSCCPCLPDLREQRSLEPRRVSRLGGRAFSLTTKSFWRRWPRPTPGPASRRAANPVGGLGNRASHGVVSVAVRPPPGQQGERPPRDPRCERPSARTSPGNRRPGRGRKTTPCPSPGEMVNPPDPTQAARVRKGRSSSGTGPRRRPGHRARRDRRTVPSVG